jgi:hypothetical protein
MNTTNQDALEIAGLEELSKEQQLEVNGGRWGAAAGDGLMWGTGGLIGGVVGFAIGGPIGAAAGGFIGGAVAGFFSTFACSK